MIVPDGVFAAEEPGVCLGEERNVSKREVTKMQGQNHQYFTKQQLFFQNCCIFAAG